MVKKLLLFSVAFLTLVFTGNVSADPNLVGWWRFEGDANDSSVYGNDGTIYGNPVFQTGLVEEGIDCNGLGDYIEVTDDSSMSFGTGSFTISLWLKSNASGIGEMLINGTRSSPLSGCHYSLNYDSGKTVFSIDDDSQITKLYSNSTTYCNGEWVHITAVRHRIDDQLYLYKNGVSDGNEIDITNNTIDSPGEVMFIGRDPNGLNYVQGMMDEIRLFDYALSEDEILILANPVHAWDPIPVHNAQNLLSDTSLSWKPGTRTDIVDGHDVYFGTGYSEVNDANRSLPIGGVRKDSNDITGDPNRYYFDPGVLEPSKDYYWRIDTINTSGQPQYKGQVWYFKTAPTAAYSPVPFNAARYVPTDANLVWMAGEGAASHDVYFGTGLTAVTDANNSSAEFMGNQVDTEFDPNDPTAVDLLENTIYYWRVDEVNSVTVKGQVWSFTTCGAADANLVGYWKFDEQGSRAYDASGNGNVGTIYGSPAWDTNGVRETALIFDGTDDYIVVPDSNEIDFGPDSFSIVFWTKSTYQGIGRVLVKGTSDDAYPGATGKRYEIIVYSGGRLRLVLDDGPDKKELSSVQAFCTGDWVHVALIRDVEKNQLRIYADGQLTNKLANEGDNTGGDINSPNEPLVIGAQQAQDNTPGTYDEFFEGTLDDIRLYNYPLEWYEISNLAREDFSQAWLQWPDDNTTNIRQDTVLSWLAGDNAIKHDVYFGTGESDVNDANDSDITGIYKGGITDTSWDPMTDANYAGGLDWNTSYYWRIDEVNSSDVVFVRGSVWEFRTADYIVVDDFELFDDDVNLGRVWKDGVNPSATSGSEISLDEIGGRGATGTLVYDYNNTGMGPAYVEYGVNTPCYSEIEADTNGPNSLDCGSDWTREGVKALMLYFKGDVDNDVAGEPNRMYLVVEDGDGNDANAMVQYGSFDDEDMNDLKVAAWQRWDIDLTELSNEVNLANIAKVYIGFGLRGEPNQLNGGTPGGWGTVYFDDIGLYKSQCIPAYTLIDMTGDCLINSYDLDIMTRDWLVGDYNAVAVNPGTMAAHYEFEDDPCDSVGSQDGTAYGSLVYVPGRVGTKAISFDGDDDYVVVPDGNTTEFGTGPFTIGFWIKTTNASGQLIINGTSNASGKRYDVRFESTYFIFTVDDDVADDAQIAINSSDVATGEWVHLGAIRDRDANQLRLYVDGFEKEGVPGDTGEDNLGDISSLNEPLIFGMASEDIMNIFTYTDFYEGQLDDVRFYSKALSEGEVTYLANDGQDLYHPITSPAELYAQEPKTTRKVNLKDFALLAGAWLDEELWP